MRRIRTGRPELQRVRVRGIITLTLIVVAWYVAAWYIAERDSHNPSTSLSPSTSTSTSMQP